jgi:phage regulator Rha-like protein
MCIYYITFCTSIKVVFLHIIYPHKIAKRHKKERLKSIMFYFKNLEKSVPVISSREIAKYFNKAHAEVLKYIEGSIVHKGAIQLLEGISTNVSNFFIEYEYTDDMPRTDKVYLLTFKGFTLIAPYFNGRKSVESLIRLTLEFIEMEEKSIEESILPFLKQYSAEKCDEVWCDSNNFQSEYTFEEVEEAHLAYDEYLKMHIDEEIEREQFEALYGCTFEEYEESQEARLAYDKYLLKQHRKIL